MRKFSLVIILICTITMVFGLSSCGDKGDSGNGKSDSKEEVVDTIEGRFFLSGMVEGENVISAEEMDARGAVDFFIDFKDDKTFIISVSGEDLSGTYEKDGETVRITMDDEEEPIDASLIGNEFIIENEGVKMTFKRQE